MHMHRPGAGGPEACEERASCSHVMHACQGLTFALWQGQPGKQGDSAIGYGNGHGRAAGVQKPLSEVGTAK